VYHQHWDFFQALTIQAETPPLSAPIEILLAKFDDIFLGTPFQTKI